MAVPKPKKFSIANRTSITTVNTRKKVSGMNLSGFPAHNRDEQHKPEAQSGAKPKTLAYGGGECIEPKVGNFHIYKVSDTQDVDKSGHQISLRTNHFPLKTNIPGRIICYYNLYIISPEKEEVKKFN